MCEYCLDYENLPDDFSYCPKCGSSIEACRSIAFIQKCIDKYLLMLRGGDDHNVIIDGEILPIEYISSSPKKKLDTPLNMACNLDKIDISREMDMLGERLDPNYQAKKAAGEHFKDILREKLEKALYEEET